MNVGIMQPYLFPYLGYYQLMAVVDHWVFFDDIQFVNRGWINRNRILHPDPAKEWQYFTLPLKGKSRFDKISDIEIDCNSWRCALKGKLSSYKKSAPFYRETIEVLDYCISSESNYLGKFVISTLKNMARMLEIDTIFHIQSDMKLELQSIEHPGQWALEISRNLGASRYINPIGGRSLFKSEEFRNAGIELCFYNAGDVYYCQGSRSFTANLSILDFLMWNGIKRAIEILQLSHEGVVH